MRRKKRFWLFLAATICFAALVAALAPSIVRSMFADYINRSELDKSLKACKPDEVIYVAFHGLRAQESANFNFTTKKLTGGDAEGSAPSLFGGSDFYYNIRLGDDKPYTDDQIRQIKGALAALPAPIRSPIKDISYRDQLHLAFYRDDHLIIYHYPKYLAPPQLTDLCQALKVSEHAD